MNVGSIVKMAKSASRFIDGHWTKAVGKECLRARKNGTATIMSFNWGKSYDTFQKTADVTKEVTKATGTKATEAAKTALEAAAGKGKQATARAARAAARDAALKAAEEAGIKADPKIMQQAVKTISREAATKAATKPGFFSKIGAMLGKIPGAKMLGKLAKGIGGKLLAFLNVIFVGHAFISGYKEGGLWEGIKEASKMAISFAGFVACSAAAVALGATGIGAFALALAGSFVIDKMATGVLGKSIAEKKEELAELQQQQQQQQWQGPVQNVDMNRIKHCLDDVNKMQAMSNNSGIMPSMGYMNGMNPNMMPGKTCYYG